MILDNRKYLIFLTSELDLIDFNSVLETSSETVRKSADNTKTFVKWDGEMPECLTQLTETWGPYTYEEILEIMNTEEWAKSEDTYGYIQGT
jgi:hypothetical protein